MTDRTQREWDIREIECAIGLAKRGPFAVWSAVREAVDRLQAQDDAHRQQMVAEELPSFGQVASGALREIRKLQSEVVQWKREAGKYSAGCELCAPREAENERLQAALDQIHGFASVMDESNWRDLRLHIERQCSARGAFEPAENERRRERLVRGNER